MAVPLAHRIVTVSLPCDRTQDEESLLAREWLVTNGLGGYASSTLLCAPTRRYHGLFVPDLPSPWGRTVLIPRLEEVVRADAFTVDLSGVEFEDGRVDGELPAVEGRYDMQLCDGAPPLKLCLRPSCGLFVADARLSHGICYRLDRDRGAEHLENLSSLGYFQADVTREQSVACVASTEAREQLECRPEALFEAESHRIVKLLHPVRAGGADETEERLVLAADQFIVVPGSRVEEQALARASGEEARTVIAGYHWFTDWGRDTMISLEGLTLCTGRHQEARSVLKTLAGYVQEGCCRIFFQRESRTASTIRRIQPCGTSTHSIGTIARQPIETC